jgi:hypothetical protein
MIWLLIGYMWLFIHRPFEVWPALGDMHIELIFALLACAVWLLSGNKILRANSIHYALAAFAMAALICSALSPWSEECWPVAYVYCTILVFYCLLVTSVGDQESLKRIAVAFLVATALYMFHSLWEFRNGRHIYRMSVARLIGVDLTYGDPNSFAASILMSLAFVPAVWLARPSTLARRLLVGYVILSCGCIVLTGSRSGFVGTVLCAAVIIGRSRLRWQLAPVALVAAPFLFLALPDSLQNRFMTIIDPSVGPVNAQMSAEGRVQGLLVGMQLWNDNPLTGVGPNAWIAATHRSIRAHNLYGQLAGEMGTLGVLTFAGLLIAQGVNFYQIRKLYRAHPEWGHDFLYEFNNAISLGLLLLLFEGNFGHNLFRYHWVWFAAFMTITRGILNQRVQDGDAPVPLAAYYGRPFFELELGQARLG